MSRSKYMSKWKKEHSEYVAAEKRRYWSKLRVVRGGGFCWICGEFHPLVLESHHLFGKNKKDKRTRARKGDFIAGICANCHRKYGASNQEKHCIAILNAIENGVMWGK